MLDYMNNYSKFNMLFIYLLIYYFIYILKMPVLNIFKTIFFKKEINKKA